MRTVCLESPYAGDVRRNLAYLDLCMAFCLRGGSEPVAPFASHGLYTRAGVLRDEVPEERRLGMKAGFAIGDLLDERWLFTDLGTSTGMRDGETRGRKRGQIIEHFEIKGWAFEVAKSDLSIAALVRIVWG